MVRNEDNRAKTTERKGEQGKKKGERQEGGIIEDQPKKRRVCPFVSTTCTEKFDIYTPFNPKRCTETDRRTGGSMRVGVG